MTVEHYEHGTDIINKSLISEEAHYCIHYSTSRAIDVSCSYSATLPIY